MSYNENEKTQYRNWIHKLLPQKENELSLIQLKMIHFILGYNTTILSENDLVEYAAGFELTENETRNLWQSLYRQGLLILKEPYPIK